MANSLLTLQILANETLRLMLNDIGDWGEMAYCGDAQVYMLRRPQVFVASFGDLVTPMDMLTETVEAVEVMRRLHVDYRREHDDFTMSIDRFAERYLAPCSYGLSSSIKGAWTFGATMVAGDLALPLSAPVDECARATDGDSLALRMISAYDIATDSYMSRVDVRLGFSKSPVRAFAPGNVASLLNARNKLQSQLDVLRCRRAA